MHCLKHGGIWFFSNAHEERVVKSVLKRKILVRPDLTPPRFENDAQCQNVNGETPQLFF